MTNQSLQTWTQIAIAFGFVITAIGGYGSFYYGRKIDQERSVKIRPDIDLCNRGISVVMLDDTTAHFDIPYCSGKNANAYSVKLESLIVLKQNEEFQLLTHIVDEFPDNITLTYEQGKTILFNLSPFNSGMLNKIFICVTGHFANEDESLTIPVLDIYKLNSFENTWVR